MKIKKVICIIIALVCITNCSQEEDFSSTLYGNLDLELIYADETSIELNWDNSQSSSATLNLQAIVFDPAEHNSTMSTASQNQILQIGSYSTETEENITVTASYYYVFLMSDTEATNYDCVESNNSDLMESFELCQAYLYLLTIFN